MLVFLILDGIVAGAVATFGDRGCGGVGGVWDQLGRGSEDGWEKFAGAGEFVFSLCVLGEFAMKG